MYEKDLRELIIRPALEYFELWSRSAENLLALTASIETYHGYYLSGSYKKGIGIYGMTSKAANNVWNNFVSKYSDLEFLIKQFANIPQSITPVTDDELLISNLKYSTIMARLKYLMLDKNLPEYDDACSMAAYYTNFYDDERVSGDIKIPDDSEYLTKILDSANTTCSYRF